MIDGEILNETSLVKPTFTMDVEVKIPDNLPKVEHNLDQLKEYVISLNDFYKKVVITSDAIKEAEAEKAKLNNLIKQIKRLRIDKVAEYKKPADDFETTAKEIEGILESASNTIKISLDTFENKRIEEKREKVIKPMINNIVSQSFVKGYLINPANIIENHKWFNKTFKDSDIEAEIQEQVDEIIRQEDNLNQGIEVIKSNIKMANNPSLNEDMYIERFRHNRDLTSVLNDIARDNKVQIKPNEHDVTLTSDGQIFVVDNTDITTNNTITFRGTPELIESIRIYAKELGLEEVI